MGHVPASPAAEHHDPRYLWQAAKLAAITIVEVGIAVAAGNGVFGDWRGIAVAALACLSLWKAGIVGRHYMHLAYEKRALILVALFPIAVIVVLFTGFTLDHVILGQGHP